jgi:capsular exopolysaccharide synthesis family protein
MNQIANTKLRTSTGLYEYISVIFRRKWIILLSFLSVFLSTIYYVKQIEDIFESYSTIVIEDKTVYVNQIISTPVRSLDFYEGILNSRSFLKTVLDSTGIEIFQKYNPKFGQEEALNFINENLVLRKTMYTSFLELSAHAPVKELAYSIASKGTEIFRTRCQEVASEESRRAVTEIEKQLELIRSNLERAEHDYRSFSEKNGQLQEGSTPELKTLQEAYASGLAQSGVKEADLDAEKKILAGLEIKINPESDNRSPEYLKLRSRLRELEKEKMRLEELGIRLSGISTVDREIQEVESELLKYKQSSTMSTTTDPGTIRQWQELRKSVLTKETELELFKRKLEAYKKAINSYKTENPDILSNSLELLRLGRSKEIYENIYSILLEKLEEERIKSRSSTAGVKIVDLPLLPTNPIPKNENRFYLLGIILGLILGFGLAFLLELNDTSLKNNEDIERYLQLPVLGTIPHIVINKKSDIEIQRKSAKSSKQMSVTQYPRSVLNFSGDDSVIAESYRSLRTNLSFVSPDHPLRTIALTSAGPSEGKSLTISNLAMAYAQMGKRTLLVDSDLRRPVLHHIFNQKREPGLSDCFIENPDYERIFKKTEKEHLFVITAGTFSPNPAELIGSNRMSKLIEFFKEQFDIVFFDTPPIVAVTDATLLGKKMDGLLLVIRSNHTDRIMASRAISNISNVGVNVIGTVLNDINLSNRYTSYGYYKYYYHYYKSRTT